MIVDIDRYFTDDIYIDTTTPQPRTSSTYRVVLVYHLGILLLCRSGHPVVECSAQAVHKGVSSSSSSSNSSL